MDLIDFQLQILTHRQICFTFECDRPYFGLGGVYFDHCPYCSTVTKCYSFSFFCATKGCTQKLYFVWLYSNYMGGGDLDLIDSQLQLLTIDRYIVYYSFVTNIWLWGWLSCYLWPLLISS